MNKVLLIIAGLLFTVLLALVILVAVQPDEYSVERSITIEAPRSHVFAYVNELETWEQWSPWADLDPNVENTYRGPSRGEGSVFEWSGNDDVGSGRMRITESDANGYISIDLEFIEPFESQSQTEFELTDGERGATELTWSMTGENNFLSKALGLFMSMEDMIGDDFEKGLEQLKQVVESGPRN